MRNYILPALFLASLPMLAAPVSPEIARQEAVAFRENRASFVKRVPRSDSELSLSYTSASSSGNCFYVFNNEGGGFTIISADDRLPSVLAFSDNGDFNEKRIPENMRWWLEQYNKEISTFLEKNPDMTPSRRPALRVGEERTPIAPLLKTTWDQTEPYNNDCPVDNYGRLSVTGCVATAMAQIMKFHEWPVNPKGSSGGVTFTGTTLDWANMIDSYENGNYSIAQADAVALLMRQCGASVNMQYSSYASGAYSMDVPNAWMTYFDYSSSMRMLYRDYYSQVQWNNMVYDELAQGRPIYYCGQSTEGGHAFVCDGYIGDDMFHFNWGWSGYQDGYFRLNVLNPLAGGTGSYSGGYNSDQSIIIGVKKNDGATRRQQMLLSLGNFTYDSANDVYVISDSPNGYNLIYNPLGYNQNFVPGLKISPVDGSEPTFVSTGRNTTLNPGYGFTEMKCYLPSLPDGEYHVAPAELNEYDEWQDILVPYGMQRYVNLKVENGVASLTNEGPGPESQFDLIFNTPEFVSPVYSGDAQAFRMNVINVAQGDFYNYISLYLISDDPFGSSVQMSNRSAVPGMSSNDLYFSEGKNVTPGNYHLYVFDSKLNQLVDPFPVTVRERADRPEVAVDAYVSKVSPYFADVEDEVGASFTAVNSTDDDIDVVMTLKLLNADSMAEVAKYQFGNVTFPAKRTVTFNAELGNIPDVKAGSYYWVVENADGNRVSAPQPVIFEGPEFESDGLRFTVTDEGKRECRLLSVVDEEASSITVPAKAGDYTVISMRPDVFTFNPVVEAVNLPGGIMEIPNGEFYSANNLRYLNMAVLEAPSRGERSFAVENIPNVTVSSLPGLTYLLQESDTWAPFNYSYWTFTVDAGISIGNLGAQNGVLINPFATNPLESLSVLVESDVYDFVRLDWSIEEGESGWFDVAPGKRGWLPLLYGKHGSVHLSQGDGSGVSAPDGDDALMDVYTASGIRVLKNASKEQIRLLPAGVYIAGGKKLVVK